MTVLYLRPARRYRRGRYSRRGAGSGYALPVVIAVAVLAAGASAKAVTTGHRHSPAPASPVVPGAGEAGFFTAGLTDIGGPATAANLGARAAWASHEGPWGRVGQWNPLDTILPEPGSWAFNSFGNGLVMHVQSYPSAATGA